MNADPARRLRCPCCRAPAARAGEVSADAAIGANPAPAPAATAGDGEFVCPACAHRWREDRLPAGHYRDSRLRTPPGAAAERKYGERLAAVAPLLAGCRRVIEIGCADGAFGARVKAAAPLFYCGVEISGDAAAAAGRLDRVLPASADAAAAGPFDLLLAFHVLEHLADPAAELAGWRALLAADARLLVEVPNGGGHPLHADDRHPEHLHRYTPASLAALLAHAGFAPLAMSSGHFESARYADSLRMLARIAPDAAAQRAALLARFCRLLPGRFVVCGLGGDFRNDVLPLLAELPVAALCDSDPERHGETLAGHAVAAYDAAALRSLPVLIASSRHAAGIRAGLVAQGVPAASIVDLDRIHGDD